MAALAHCHIRIDHATAHLALDASDRRCRSHPWRVNRVVQVQVVRGDEMHLGTNDLRESLAVGGIDIGNLPHNTFTVSPQLRVCAFEFLGPGFLSLGNEDALVGQCVRRRLSPTESDHRLGEILAALLKAAVLILRLRIKLVHDVADGRNIVAVLVANQQLYELLAFRTRRDEEGTGRSGIYQQGPRPNVEDMNLLLLQLLDLFENRRDSTAASN